MIIDGKKIAKELFGSQKERIAALPKAPHLTIVTCAPTFATKRYIELKKQRAQEIGAMVAVTECVPESTTEELVTHIQEILPRTDGVVVQLPLPSHIDTQVVLDAVPLSHDVDANSASAREKLKDGSLDALPPVAAAIALLVERHGIDIRNKHVVVIGEGRLVGAPSAVWFTGQGSRVMTLNKETKDITSHTKEADVLVLGAGVPKLVTLKMIREGVVIFDAGTSEESGKLVGDADPRCAEKASLFTPVPGGIGPITVAMLFQNLLTLTKAKPKGVRRRG